MIYSSIIYHHIPPRFFLFLSTTYIIVFRSPSAVCTWLELDMSFFPKFGRKDGRFGWEAPRQLRIRRFWAPTPSGSASDGRFFFLNCKDGLMDDLHWFTYGCWMCFCSISFILSHDIVFSVFFSILKMGDWCFYVCFLVGFGVCLLFRQSFRRQSLMHTENVFFSSNSVLLGVLNAFLRCTPWCWMVCPPSRGSCLPLSSIVPLLVSLCWRLGLKTRAFLDALPIGTACFCAFLPRTSVFRGVGVGVGWDGVGWG